MLGCKDRVAVFHPAAHHVVVVRAAIKERHLRRAAATVHRDHQRHPACRIFRRDVDSLSMHTRQDRDHRPVVDPEAVFPDLRKARLLFRVGLAGWRPANALGEALA